MTTHRLPAARRIALMLGLGGLLVAVAACSGSTSAATLTQVAGSTVAGPSSAGVAATSGSSRDRKSVV